MARLPATQSSSSPQLSKREAKILKALMKGYDSGTIARKLAGEAPSQKTLQRLRREVRTIAARSQEWQEMQHRMAMVALTEGLEGAGDGLKKMAKRGRSPQAKLLMEATGFYTPHSRQDVNHSGEIEIKMTGIPRPTHQVEEAVEAQAYEDAEVVD